MIREAAQALRPYLDRPFVFFGHSLGALVSFELARYLDSHYGLSPVQLFISGHNAPQLPNPESPIHKLPEREFVESLRQLNGMADDILGNTELMQLLIPILRADFEVCETYGYQAGDPLTCPISAFGGLRDRYVSREGLEAWREQTTGPFSLRMFPGDHFYINTDRPILLQAVARDINPFLELILG